MAEKIKVYHPTVIEDTPFPGQEGEVILADSQAKNGVHSPNTIKGKQFPRKRVAVELLGSALNTRSRRILAEFQFTEMGAIQIGKYKNAISGDLRISPNGITARDKAGVTTFAIDGTTGDAVFKGEVRSGSLVTGEIVVGNNNVIIDGSSGQGKMVINDGTTDIILIGFQEGGFS
jgi:hypothetical protein|tara:strand:- start:4912 stop:5436 length:525 start_codon:yes stop_codon:yes gene_type:complete